MKPILITGGTGTIGRHVVRRLREKRHDVRIFARWDARHENDAGFISGDLISGAGLDAAVDGVATIIHCAGSNKGDEVATQNLVRAAARGPSTSHLHLSGRRWTHSDRRTA